VAQSFEFLNDVKRELDEEVLPDGKCALDGAAEVHDLIIIKKGTLLSIGQQFRAGAGLGELNVLGISNTNPGTLDSGQDQADGPKFTAVSECVLLRLRRTSFERITEQYPEVAEEVARIRQLFGCPGPVARGPARNPDLRLTGKDVRRLQPLSAELVMSRAFVLTDGAQVITRDLVKPSVDTLLQCIHDQADEYYDLPFTIDLQSRRLRLTWKDRGVVRTRARLSVAKADPPEFQVAAQSVQGTGNEVEVQELAVATKCTAYCLDSGAVVRSQPTRGEGIHALGRAFKDALPERKPHSMVIGPEHFPYNIQLAQDDEALLLVPRVDSPAMSCAPRLYSSGRLIATGQNAAPFMDSAMMRQLSQSCRDTLTRHLERCIVLPGRSVLHAEGALDDHLGVSPMSRGDNGVAVFIASGTVSKMVLVDDELVATEAVGPCASVGLANLFRLFAGTEPSEPWVNYIAADVVEAFVLRRETLDKVLKWHEADAAVVAGWEAAVQRPPGQFPTHLEKVQSISSASDEFRSQLWKTRETKLFFPGEEIVRLGDRASTLVVIHAGRATMQQGATIKEWTQGNIVGDRTFRDKKATRPFTVRAISTVMVAVYHQSCLDMLCKMFPDQCDKMMQDDLHSTEIASQFPFLQRCSAQFREAVARQVVFRRVNGEWTAPVATILVVKGAVSWHAFKAGDQVKLLQGQCGVIAPLVSKDKANLQVMIDKELVSAPIAQVCRLVGYVVSARGVRQSEVYECDCFGELAIADLLDVRIRLEVVSKMDLQIAVLTPSDLQKLLKDTEAFPNDREVLQEHFAQLVAEGKTRVLQNMYNWHEKCPTFRKMSPECREALDGCIETSIALPGSVLVKEGDESRHICIICRGTAVVMIGDEVMDSIPPLPAGTFFGEQAMISHSSTASASIVARTTMAVVRFPHAEFLKVRDQFPDVFAEFNKVLDARYQSLTDVDPQKLFETNTFASCTAEFRTHLIRLLEKKVLPPGEVLMQQGEIGFDLFFVARGTLEIQISGNRVNTISSGNVVGEMAALGVNPYRNATCVALTVCVVFKLTQDQLGHTLKKFPDQKSIFAWRCRSKNEDQLLQHVAQAPAFTDFPDGSRGLTARTIAQLSNKLESTIFLTGERIMKQGQRDDCLYIIDFGQVSAEVIGFGELPTSKGGHGQVWGETCFLGSDSRHKVTLTAQTITHVRFCNKEMLKDLPTAAVLFEKVRVKMRTDKIVASHQAKVTFLAQAKVHVRKEKAFVQHVDKHRGNSQDTDRPQLPRLLNMTGDRSQSRRRRPARVVVRQQGKPPGFEGVVPAWEDCDNLFAESSLWSTQDKAFGGPYLSSVTTSAMSNPCRTACWPKPDVSVDGRLMKHLGFVADDVSSADPAQKWSSSRSMLTNLRAPLRPQPVTAEEGMRAVTAPSQPDPRGGVFFSLNVRSHYLLSRG